VRCIIIPEGVVVGEWRSQWEGEWPDGVGGVTTCCGNWGGIYRVSHELRSLLRESVPSVKLYRYNPKHLYPKFNGYGDIGQRSMKL